MLRFLIDNMVPRGVTKLLRRLAHDAVEVRNVLTEDADDGAVVAYAHAQRRIVVTHDPGVARRCKAMGVQHVWLRTRESDDAMRLEEIAGQLEAALQGTALRVRVHRQVLRVDSE